MLDFDAEKQNFNSIKVQLEQNRKQIKAHGAKISIP